MAKPGKKKKVLFVKRIKTCSNGMIPKKGMTVVNKIVVIAIGSTLVTQRMIAPSSSAIEQKPSRLKPCGSGKNSAPATRITAIAK